MLEESVQTTRVQPWPARPQGAADRVNARAGSVVLALGGIVVASTLVRFTIAALTPAPWIMPDELIYSELTRSVAHFGTFAVRGAPWSAVTYGPLYPLLLAPLFRAFGATPDAYLAAKALNCFVFSTAAVPAYLLARPLLRGRGALLFAAAAVAVPSGIYTTKLMTESLAYPAFLSAVVAMLWALRDPRLTPQLVALGATVFAIGTRAQMGVLLPAFLVATLLERRRREFMPAWLVVGGAAAVALIAAFARGASPASLLGAHEVLLERIHVVDAPVALLQHLAALDLYVGIVPLIALALVIGGRPERLELRTFCVLSTALLVCFLTLAAVYATQEDAPKIFDRYLFYVAPLLFLALFVWLSESLSERRLGLATTSAIGVALPFVLPYSELLGDRLWGVSSSSVGLVPLGLIRLFTGTTWPVYVALTFGCISALWLLLQTPRSVRRLSAVVALVLLVGNVATFIGNVGVSASARKNGFGRSSTPDWIDRAVGRTALVDVLWPGLQGRSAARWHTVWQSEFFNQSVGRVYDLREPLRYDLPETRLGRDGASLLLPTGAHLRARYVLTDRSVQLVGTRVAANAETGMVLYRVDGAVRLR